MKKPFTIYQYEDDMIYRNLYNSNGNKPMTFNQAVHLYLSTHPKRRELVIQLMKWNSKETLKEAASKWNKTKNSIMQFATLYGLKYKRELRGRPIGSTKH